MKTRMRAKLKQVYAELRQRKHVPVPEVGAWLRTVVQGWYRYYAVPLTSDDLSAFREQVRWLWYQVLRRRSQRARLTQERLSRLTDRWLPRPRILHPYPQERFDVRIRGKSRMR